MSILTVIGPGLSANGQLWIGSGSGPLSPATLTAGSNVTITNTANAISIAASGGGGGGLTWVDQASTPVTMTTNYGYTCDDGSTLVVFTLPTTSAIGDQIEINGKGSGGWQIAQVLGQQIVWSGGSTTSGSTGSLSSSGQYDCVVLRCLTANTIWVLRSVISEGIAWV